MEVPDTDRSNAPKKTIIAKMFKVRKRREMLFVQVCFICSVLFVAWTMSVLLTKTGECTRGGYKGTWGRARPIELSTAEWKSAVTTHLELPVRDFTSRAFWVLMVPRGS